MHQSPSEILAANYLTALQLHVEKNSPATMLAAQPLGQTAVEQGLETLWMANMHDQALAVLLAKDSTILDEKELTQRASSFFAEAIMPIEKTHQAASEGSANFEQLSINLAQRNSDLTESNRELRGRIDDRKSAEAALEASQHSSRQLLKDSQLLEQQLKDMTRKILSATENERHAMSLLLNNEIAQNLLGINIRLIAMKNDIETNQSKHNDEIDMIQQVVEDSVKIIKRLAYEFRANHA